MKRFRLRRIRRRSGGCLTGMHPRCVFEYVKEMGDKAWLRQITSRRSHIAAWKCFPRCMEPHACVAYHNRDATIDYLESHQSVFGLRTVIADLFDMQYHKVRLSRHHGRFFRLQTDWILQPCRCATWLRANR